MDQRKTSGPIHRSFNWENPNVSFDESPHFDHLEKNGIPGTFPLLELFLDLPEHSPRGLYEGREIRASCSEHIAELRHGATGAPQGLAVWMDDRCRKGGGRYYNGPMKVKDWLERLELKRFGEKGHPDAETRRMYIPNPNSWSLGTLISRANKGQIPVLRKCIRRHLEGEASIKVGFPGRFFVLEFHLPFIAWREQASKDGRKKADGTPLRSSQSLSSLSGSQENAEATNAWVMADTYFHDVEDKPNNRDMLEYYDDADEKGDPLTRGELLVDPPLWDPREYFLMVLKIRLRQVEDEWRSILYVVKGKVKNYLKDSHINVPPMRFSLVSVDEKVQAVRNSYSWVRELKSILAYLSNAISTTTAACDSFENQDVFYYPDGIGNLNALLYDVIESFGELREVEGILQNINRSVDDFKQQLDLYLLVEGNYALAQQQWNVTILHLFGPPTLATGIIQSGVVQLQPPIVCFLVLTVAIAAFAWAARPVLTSVASWRPPRNATQELEDVHFGYTRDGTPIFGSDMRGGGAAIQLPKPTFFRAGTLRSRRSSKV